MTSFKLGSRRPGVGIGGVLALLLASCSGTVEVTGDGPADGGRADGRVLGDGPLDDGAGSPTDRAGAMDGRAGDGPPLSDGPGPSDRGDATVEPGPPAVRLIGRIDSSDAAGPRFAWSGSAVTARFEGSAVSIRLAEQGPNFFLVVIDGVEQPRLATQPGEQSYALAAGLGSGPHELLVWRLTEAFQGETQFLGLEYPAGGALLAPPAAPARRLEVIGDSISCAYGVEGADETCHFSADTENHYLAYESLVARGLGAELHTVAWSGKGLYRNLGGDMDALVPALFQRTLPTRADSTWDFSSWIPDVVVINLGTNDFGGGLGDPGDGYQSAYVDFLTTLRGHYPGALLVGTIGPLLGGDELALARDYITGAIATRMAAGDTRLAYLEYPTQTADNGFGCDYHPSRRTHELMAAQLEALLTEQLGW